MAFYEKYAFVERKMDPYQFWQSIGSPKLVVAPMVDQSDLAFRMLTRKYGSHLVYTQMINANSFVVSKECRSQLFEINPQDRPLVVQIAGHDPQVMLQAAKMVQDHCDAIDINLGCPQGIAKRGCYGAFLMEELDLLYEIVSTLVQGLNIPVFCKSRIYPDFERTITLYETLYRAGASALTIHGRTRDSKGQLVGACDWAMIQRIKTYFMAQRMPIPIMANGGIESIQDVIECFTLTQVDAVMSSEAILENPALFLHFPQYQPLQQQPQIDHLVLSTPTQMDLAGMFVCVVVSLNTLITFFILFVNPLNCRRIFRILCKISRLSLSYYTCTFDENVVSLYNCIHRITSSIFRCDNIK
jgi:tRNA-dihydrouridine synthase